MKGSPLLVAVLVMAAATVEAQPATPTGTWTATFKIDIFATRRTEDMLATRRTENISATRRTSEIRLWHLEPIIGATAQPVSSSPLSRVMDKRRWELRLGIVENRHWNIDWLGLFTDELRLDGIMHMKRMTEPKTVREVYHQKHFEGYLKGLDGYWTTPARWNDGDRFVNNDINHPFMGSLYSLIYTNNDRRCKDTTYGDRGYWACVRRATIFSALASVNWEWNPLMSETAIGQVGRHYTCVTGSCAGEGGWSDFVMTPMGGLGLRVLGDIARAKLWPVLDRHLSGNRAARILNVALKIATNPSRMVNRALSLNFDGALSSPSPRRTR